MKFNKFTIFLFIQIQLIILIYLKLGSGSEQKQTDPQHFILFANSVFRIRIYIYYAPVQAQNPDHSASWIR